MLVFAAVVAAKVMTSAGGDGRGVIVGRLRRRAGWRASLGLLNGFLVAKARIPSFIVTLGTLGMALGSALLITDGVDERDVPSS